MRGRSAAFPRRAVDFFVGQRDVDGETVFGRLDRGKVSARLTQQEPGVDGVAVGEVGEDKAADTGFAGDLGGLSRGGVEGRSRARQVVIAKGGLVDQQVGFLGRADG